LFRHPPPGKPQAVDFAPPWTRERVRRDVCGDFGANFTGAVHITIAEWRGLPLLTSDRQQFVAARSLGLSPILPANPD